MKVHKCHDPAHGHPYDAVKAAPAKEPEAAAKDSKVAADKK